MRHRVSGRQLSRTTSHRKALRRNLAASLIEHGAVRTTEAKAKELQRFAERLITAARTGSLHARRRVIALLGDRDMVDDEGELLEKTVVQKLFDEIAPRYADRPGGYTRIIRLSDRRIGDAGVQVLLQLVEEGTGAAGGGGAGRRKRRAAKRHEAAAAVAAEPQAEPAEQAPETEEQEPPAEAAEPQDQPEDAEPQKGGRKGKRRKQK